MPKIIRLTIITRSFVRANNSAIFVFGDNLQERGYGGQAAAMRGEPNVVGIPTKYAPDNRPSSFFSDADFDQVRPSIDNAFDKIKRFLHKGHHVVIPTDGVGTGLAQLATKAPKIHAYINNEIEQLERDWK